MLFCREMRNSSSVMLALLSRRFTWEQQATGCISGLRDDRARRIGELLCAARELRAFGGDAGDVFASYVPDTFLPGTSGAEGICAEVEPQMEVVDVRVNPTTVNSGLSLCDFGRGYVNSGASLGPLTVTVRFRGPGLCVYVNSGVIN